MAKKSCYLRELEAEQARDAAFSARYAAMTERELVAELDAIERDDWMMRHESGSMPACMQALWERIAARNRLARAELAARRANIAA